MSSLGTCLWFDGRAEEAATFYVGAFRACGRSAEVLAVIPWGDAGPGQKGTVLSVEFVLDGRPFLALNGGPQFTFTPAVSLVVECADQREVDLFWDRLTDGGTPGKCGWLTDRFGLCWQVVPAALSAMMRDPDVERRDKVMRAFMPMTKLMLAPLQDAYGR